MNYEDICYHKTCLSQVIIRLDFLEFVDGDLLFGEDIGKEILIRFPTKGMKQLVQFQKTDFYTDANGQKTEKTIRKGIQQEFSDSDNNKLIIANTYLIVEINKYVKFEIVIEQFEPIIKKLFEKKQLTSLRTGIRFINFFGDESIKPQKNYFKTSVGMLLDSKSEINNCIRSMAMNEYKYDDMNLNFRFGMYNGQYPQVIKKQDYVLDYDCFCNEALVGFESVMNHINNGHDYIQKLFEDSITDQLRKVMNNE